MNRLIAQLLYHVCLDLSGGQPGVWFIHLVNAAAGMGSVFIRTVREPHERKVKNNF